jgi:hypothetical protein
MAWIAPYQAPPPLRHRGPGSLVLFILGCVCHALALGGVEAELFIFGHGVMPPRYCA